MFTIIIAIWLFGMIWLFTSTKPRKGVILATRSCGWCQALRQEWTRMDSATRPIWKYKEDWSSAENIFINENGGGVPMAYILRNNTMMPYTGSLQNISELQGFLSFDKQSC